MLKHNFKNISRSPHGRPGPTLEAHISPYKSFIELFISSYPNELFKLNHSNRTKSKIPIADFRVANHFAQNNLHKNAHTDCIRAYTHELSKSENKFGN